MSEHVLSLVASVLIAILSFAAGVFASMFKLKSELENLTNEKIRFLISVYEREIERLMERVNELETEIRRLKNV